MKYFIFKIHLLCGLLIIGSGCATKPTISRDATTTYKHYSHQVVSGETLSSISRFYNTPVNEIKYFNKLSSDEIKIGQTLRIPAQNTNIRPIIAKNFHNPVQTKSQNTVKCHKPSIIKNVHIQNNKVNIVPRSSWSKNKINAAKTQPMGGKPNKITVHHTTEDGALQKLNDKDFLNNIERAHINGRKFACIGYHYIIGRTGTIYEGRPISLQGAHVTSNNRLNIGISVIGDFSKHKPAYSQVAALKSLIKYLSSIYNISSKEYYGHNDLGKTQCPGVFLKQHLNAMKK